MNPNVLAAFSGIASGVIVGIIWMIVVFRLYR